MTRRVALLIIAIATLGMSLGASPAAVADPPMMLGPGDAQVHNIKDEALIRWSKWGFVYIAGQQDSRLEITFDEDANTLRYADKGTKELGTIPERCDSEKVDTGISVVCTIPEKFDDKKMFVQVWPRLGNDRVDGRTLPSRFRLWALVDAGKDVVRGGAGDDFVNGAKDADRVYGGEGDDFLRTGPGDDQLWGDDGADRLSCAENNDVAYSDGYDSFYQCETVKTG
jgi:serralysin